MACTANRLSWGRAHVGAHAWAWTDERFRCPACDNSSHRSLLWWQHPIFSTCPILLTSWHSCRGDNHHVSRSLFHSFPLKRQQRLCYLPPLRLAITSFIQYTVLWTFWSWVSLFITISNYSYLRLLHWKRAGENSLSIDYDDSETGELMVSVIAVIYQRDVLCLGVWLNIIGKGQK